MLTDRLMDPEYLAEIESALEDVKLQMTFDLLKGMIEKDHFLLMNWQLFKYPIEETAHSATFKFMGPFGELGKITVLEDNHQFDCYVDNGREKQSSEFLYSIDEAIDFIFTCVESAGKKLAA